MSFPLPLRFHSMAEPSRIRHNRHTQYFYMPRGKVKWFNEKKGFGFIVDSDVDSDIFVHFSAIQSDGFKTLNEGDDVEYELYSDEKGSKAKNVVRL